MTNPDQIHHPLVTGAGAAIVALVYPDGLHFAAKLVSALAVGCVASFGHLLGKRIFRRVMGDSVRPPPRG